jgi:hypothetical protein
MCSLNRKPTWAVQRNSLPRPDLERLAAQVLRVDLQQIEGKQEHRAVRPPVAQPVEARHPVPVAGDRFPIDEERAHLQRAGGLSDERRPADTQKHTKSSKRQGIESGW